MAVEVSGTSIRIPQGDTGPVKFVADCGEVLEGDKGIFTLARRDGSAILRKIIDAADGVFRIMFTFEDTARLKPDTYEWSFKVVRGATFDGSGKIQNAEAQNTAVIAGKLVVIATAGGAR